MNTKKSNYKPGLELATTVEVDSDQVKLLAANLAAIETATLNASLEEANKAIAELKAKVDGLTSEIEVATVAKTNVEAEFAKFKADVELEAELATLRAERVKAIGEVAPSLLEGSNKDERVERYARMEKATFEALLNDLQSIAPKENSDSKPDLESATLKARSDTKPVDAKTLARKVIK